VSESERERARGVDGEADGALVRERPIVDEGGEQEVGKTSEMAGDLRRLRFR
jgi:hypothetical protein